MGSGEVRQALADKPVLREDKRMNLTWSQLIEAFQQEHWEVFANEERVEVQPLESPKGAKIFARHTRGLHEAQTFWDDYCLGQNDITRPSLDLLYERITTLLRRERAGGRVNNLEARRTSQNYRDEITGYLQR